MGDDLARLYRLDGVAHIARVINEEPQRCIRSMRRQQGMRLDDRYVPYLHMAGWRPAWEWFQELLGVIPPPSQVQKYAINCSWFQETFGECPEGADDETVRRYAPRLEDMGTYSWGSAALAWLYWCMCRVANRNVIKLAGPLQLLQSWIFWRFPRFRLAGFETFSWPLASRWSGYNPSSSEKGPRVQMWRLSIDRLQDREVIYLEPYSSPDVLQVVHPEVLEPRHMAPWQSVTSFIYFAVIEWHQIDRVLLQFGGVQPRPHPALNIDFLMSKDGRGGDRWFPYHLQKWHLHWESRAESMLRFDVVADPGPSHEFLEW
ncbi:serine/threonine-protein phosphatase 7 long form homolog [Arachis hypogaea]|uniref:serine/threonine-protein phosphatase 7 long form homolog n=1 Tax=Arachis hypogaea TaxID=3818 RepID=UPI003B227DCB